MAVVDRYVDTLHYDSQGNLIPVDAAGTYPIAPGQNGSSVLAKSVVFTTVNGDSAGSVLRLFKQLEAEIIPLRLEITTDGITSMNDNDIGLYSSYQGGVAGAVRPAGANCLADAVDLSSAVINGAPKDGLKSVSLADLGTKRLFELAGDAVANSANLRQPGYDLAITVDTGSCGSAGKIRATLYYLQG